MLVPFAPAYERVGRSQKRGRRAGDGAAGGGFSASASRSRSSSRMSDGGRSMPGWGVRRQGSRFRMNPARPQGLSARGFLAGNDAKFVDLALGTYANNTTGSITLVATIPQGTTVNAREGKACQLTSVRIRGRVQADATTTTTAYANYLVWDSQPNKALAAITDVLGSADPSAFPNRENAQRFKIIKQWRGTLSGNTTAPAATDVTVDVDDYIPLKDCVTSFTAADTTGVIGNIVTGALLFVSVGSTVAGTADANTIVGFRVNFKD